MTKFNYSRPQIDGYAACIRGCFFPTALEKDGKAPSKHIKEAIWWGEQADLEIKTLNEKLQDEDVISILKDLSLTLDEYFDFDGSTHGIQNGKIVAKGSFIKLVEKARTVLKNRG